MNGYSIEYAPGIRDEIARLAKSLRARIDRAILSLADNPRPHGSIKLAGQENLHRIRVGDYRIIYAIHDRRRVVIVVIVAHRRDVYRDL